MPEKKKNYGVVRVSPKFDTLVVQHMNLMGLAEGRDVSRTEAVEDLIELGLSKGKGVSRAKAIEDLLRLGLELQKSVNAEKNKP